jgi:exonuclease SbcD
MKIALTADLHLTSREQHPERYHALEDILSQLVEDRIRHLFIAGDLFDASLKNYKDFELVCNRDQFRNIQIYIIPGNHDAEITAKSIVAENVKIFSQPEVIQIQNTKPSLFLLPYLPGKTMGESIEFYAGQLSPHEWILLAHGDWSDGMKSPNPYEPGIYMPLTSKDIQRYQPSRVFLGHIHKPMNKERVHYMGSPCGLDISETGIRTFLVYDLEMDECESRPVNNDIVLFDEHFIVVPAENEVSLLQQEIRKRVLAWNLPDLDLSSVNLRVKVNGYCSDRAALKATLDEAFQDFTFYRGEQPDISEVSVSEDTELQFLVDKVKERIEDLDWSASPDEPGRADILLAALKVIYGE